MKKCFKNIAAALVLCSALSGLFISCETTDEIADMLIENSDNQMDKAVGNAIKSIGNAADKFTPENEYYIGRSVAASIIAKYPLYKGSPSATTYLNSICSAITINSMKPYLYNGYCVAIMDTDEINALSTPGGHIFVSRGLIKACNSEDALAAVIAHEIAHIQLEHSMEAIYSSRTTAAVLASIKATGMVAMEANPNKKYPEITLRLADNLFDVQSEMLQNLVETGFSQSQEFEADEYALTLMEQAGYDPRAMLDMLEVISKDKHKEGWLKTHPKPAERIKKVLKALIKHNRKISREPRIDRFNRNTKGL